MYNKNGRYYAFSITGFILLHVPILTIYFNSILESMTLVGVLFFTKSLTTMIMEVPTGYIADRYSRKLSLIIGILFNMLFLFLLIYRPNFYSLIVAEISFGISECLFSGADTAFYYDNFKAENRIEDFNHLVKNIGFVQSIFLSCSFFIGSILYSYSAKSVFVVSLIFQVISLLILLTIKEHPYTKKDKSRLGVVSEIKIFCSTQNKHIIYILIIYSLILAVFSSLYLQLFPIVTTQTVDNYYIYGIIYVVVMMTYGFGAKKGNDNINTLPKALIFLIAILSSAAVFTNNVFILLVIIITRFIWGYVNTGLTIYLNNNIVDSAFRSTTFSILNMLINLFSAVFMFLIGWMLDNYLGLRLFFVVCTLIVFMLLILFQQKLLLKGGEDNGL